MYHYSIAPTVPAFRDKLSVCKQLGVCHLELPGEIDGVPFDALTPAALEDSRILLIRAGVRIIISEVSCPLTDDAALRRFMNAAHLLHVESVRLPVPTCGDDEYLRTAATVGKYAQSYGIGLLVSNDTGSFLSTDEGVTQAVRTLSAYDCGAIFDVAAYGKLVYPFFGALYKSHIKNLIRVVRVGDLNPDGSPATLGQGTCGLCECISLLLARSFDGYFSVSGDADTCRTQLHVLRELLIRM